MTKIKLTPAAKRYALELVKRRKLENEHANCVQPGFVVRMGARVDEHGNIVDRPYSSPTYETDHHKNCKLARIIPRNHCRHGKFVGDPYGPDYMCGWCEDGDDPSIYEMALNDAREKQRLMTKNMLEQAERRMLEVLVDIHKANEDTFRWIDTDVIYRLVSGVTAAGG